MAFNFSPFRPDTSGGLDLARFVEWVNRQMKLIAEAVGSSSSSTSSGPTASVAAADVANSTTTYADSGLSIAVTAGKTYHIRIMLHFTSAGDTTGVLARIQYPGTSVRRLDTLYSATSGTTLSSFSVNDNSNTAIAGPVSLPTCMSYIGTGIVIVEFAITPAASGTVKLEFRPNTTGNAKTLRAGSSMLALST